MTNFIRSIWCWLLHRNRGLNWCISVASDYSSARCRCLRCGHEYAIDVTPIPPRID